MSPKLNESEKTHLYDVIVVGAGISGLSAAKLLQDHSQDVLVLEARNRVGGRTLTIQNENVGWCDLGGAYVGRTQDRVLRMIKSLGLKLYSVNEEEKVVFYNGFDRNRLLFGKNDVYAVGYTGKMEVNSILRLIDKLGEEIPAEAPWLAPKADEWDQTSFKEFLFEHVYTESAIEFMKLFVTAHVTNEPYESSLLWFLWYVKQSGGTRRIFDTFNGAQEFKVDGGTNQITELLAEKIGLDRVKLEHPVCLIDQESTEFCQVQTLNGCTYRAKRLILSVPPTIQQKIHYRPELPPMRNQLIQRAPQGSVFKCIVYYNRIFWRPKDMCGSVIFIGPDEEFPIVFCMDDTKPDNTFPALIGFLPGDKARKISHLTKEQRMKIICESYAQAFDSDEANHPVHYEEQNWSAEQYSGGCYTMTCPPGFLTQYGPHLRKSIDRLHFGGTETATKWSGYMDGAIQAGERAARECLAAEGFISESEIWQNEPVSLEYPPLPFSSSWFEDWAPCPNKLKNAVKQTSLTMVVSLLGYFAVRNSDLL